MLLLALPIGQVFLGESTRFPLLLALVLLAAVIVKSHQRWIFAVAALIGLGAIVGIALATYSGSQLMRIATEVLGLVLLTLTSLVMFNSLIQSRRVSLDSIIGGICAYLLIGLYFAMLFIPMTDIPPGALFVGTETHRFVHPGFEPACDDAPLLQFRYTHDVGSWRCLASHRPGSHVHGFRGDHRAALSRDLRGAARCPVCLESSTRASLR